MKALDRKLLRDLLRMKGQVLAIALVIGSGLTAFVMAVTTLEALKRSKDAYYDRYRFAHVFASLERAPRTLAERIAEIPGVARVQTRIVVGVNLTVPGMEEPAVGRLISVPETGEPVLNRLHLRSGRWVERGRGEALVSEAFAAAHGLAPGDAVQAIINGKYQELRLVGIAISPEYIFQIESGGVFPDDKRFGVFWMGDEELAASFDMQEAFNNVTLQLMPGASEPEVIRQLDRLTEPYGGLGATGRAEQVSHRYISDEIRQLRGMAKVAPAIFLSVAAFLLNVVLSRLVSTQREQIAMLKAFGYDRAAIALHYLKLTAVIAVLGSAAGVSGGVYLGRGLARLYTSYYRFPVLDYRLDLWVVLVAVAIGVGAGTVAVLAAVRRAALLPPAEAMQPEPPPSFRPTLVERAGLQRWLAPATRIMVRQIERRPVKSLMTTFGIALAVAVLVLGSYMKDAIEFLIEQQTSVLQREDMTVGLVEPRSSRATREVARLPGVMQAEPFRAVAVRLRRGHRSRLVGVTGLPAGAQLTRLPGAGGEFLEPPPEGGLILSEKLGEVLGLRVGDRVEVEVLEGKRPRFEWEVAGLSRDYTGLAAHIDLAVLNRALEEGATISGALLRIDAAGESTLYRRLRELPGVAGVQIKAAAIRSFEETMAENLLRMRTFNVFFATVIAFGVVYNSARIAFAERNHELATLRVLGFTRREVAWILVGELMLLTVAALPLGWLCGRGFAWLASLGMDTEFYRIPLVIRPTTYVLATFVTLAAAFLSSLVVVHRVGRLDMVVALKCKE